MNICCAYPIYIIGIVFSHVPVLSIFIAYFTMAQILMHGIMMNKKMGTFYNPGVATALFVMVPVGLYSIWFISCQYEIPAWNWWVPILVFPVVAFLTILLPILKCQNRESPYAFPERDTKGFSTEGKVARIRR